MPILRRSVVQFCSAPLVRFHTALDTEETGFSGTQSLTDLFNVFGLRDRVKEYNDAVAAYGNDLIEYNLRLNSHRTWQRNPLFWGVWVQVPESLRLINEMALTRPTPAATRASVGENK